MKNLMIALLMFFSISVMAQERREYEQINENTVEVTVYYDDILTQKGTMRLHDDKWVPCGTWYAYDTEGDVIMTAEFKGGKKLWFKALSENKIVMIDHREKELIQK